MSNRLAVLVFGPESAGNHLMVECLIAAGCDGDASDAQRWDTQDPTAERIVWGKSVPSNRFLPDMVGMVERMRTLGYSVCAVVITRNWFATTESQVKRGHVKHRTNAHANLQRAYPYIFKQLHSANVNFVVCHYDALVANPQCEMTFIVGWLGLSLPDALYVYDGNRKHGSSTAQRVS